MAVELVPAGATPVPYPLAERIPEILVGPDSDLDGLRVVVTGLGVSGYPMAVHLAERGARVIVVDGDTQRDLSEHIRILEVFDVDIRRGVEHTRTLPDFDGLAPQLVCTSPGWRPDQPLLLAARAAGVPVIGEVELAWRVRGANQAPWLVVTGTNGKTTTTSLLAAMLTAGGCEARACGNIGAPLLEAVLDPTAEVLAIELSSFQLHWEHSMCAHSAVVLNLAEDHLDWHGGLAAYGADKAKVYANVGHTAVYNTADPATLHMVEQAEVLPGARAVGFTVGAPLVGQIGLIEDILVDRAFTPHRYSAAAELATLDDVSVALGVPADHLAPHHVANVAAAAALARSFGVEPAAVRAGLLAHHPGDHRGTVVGTVDGVAFIDDSKATNPHAAAADLAARERLVWVAGGLAKGADMHDLVAEHAARLAGVVLIGRDPAPFASALAENAPRVPVVRIDPASLPADPVDPAARGTEVMRAAVRAGAQLAGPGLPVVLAPAAASMDQFLNYATRGDLFAAAVRDLED